MTLEMLCLLEPAIADGTLSQDHDDSRDDARKGQQRDRARSIVQLPAIHLGGGHWRRRGKQSSERGRDVFRPWGAREKLQLGFLRVLVTVMGVMGVNRPRLHEKKAVSRAQTGQQSAPALNCFVSGLTGEIVPAVSVLFQHSGRSSPMHLDSDG